MKTLLPKEPSRVLEIGTGLGGFAARISRYHAYVGYEPDVTSFAVARQRLTGYRNAEIRREEVGPATIVPGLFDVLVAFEVLEHLDADADALSGWLRSVRPGGVVIFSVPAHRSRFGCWDTLVGHRQRYDREDLDVLLTSTGLTPERVISYGFPTTRLTEWVRNAFCKYRPPAEAGTAASGRLFQPTGSVGFLINLLQWPMQLLQRPFFNTDLGTGWVVAARRSS